MTRREGREALLLHRAPGGGAYWHVVAGAIEPGETAAEAAARELLEETGLRAAMSGGVAVTEYVHVPTLEPRDERSRFDQDVVALPVTCFTTSAPDDWDPSLDPEHDAHRWCTASEALATLRWPGTVQGLRALVQALRFDPAHGGYRLDVSGYSKKNLRADVENAAPKFDMPSELQARFARGALGGETLGLSLMTLEPGFRIPFGHKHEGQEEVYVVVRGSGRVKVGDEVVELAEWDAIRFDKSTMRNMEAGPDGIEYLAFGAGDDPLDADMAPGWWSD